MRVWCKRLRWHECFMFFRRNTELHVSAPFFTDVGSPDQPAVVFLHGVGGGRHGWAPQQAHLSVLGWRSLAWDMPGYGESAMVTPYDFEHLAMAMWQMLDAAHIRKAVLVGHSMGAMVALQAWTQMPERITAMVLAASSRPRMRSGFCVQACRATMAPMLWPTNTAWSMCAASSICQRACARCEKS